VKGAIIAALVLVGALALIALAPSKSWYPSSWDPRIAPIAAQVEQLRGLNFVHPVQVHFLNSHDFNQVLEGKGGDTTSAADRESFATEAAVGRALGFVGGKDDLAQASKTQAESDVAAFYSNTAKEVFVNGTAFDVEHQVTVAHELTHVLQDQHFDLGTLAKKAAASKTGDTEAYTALIEGDAVRIQDDYLKGLTTAQQREYIKENNASAGAADSADASVPDMLEFIFQAPYEFGPATANILFSTGENLAVDNALTGPTPGARILLEPAELTPPDPVANPVLPAGARRVSEENQETISAFELYPMLATTLAPADALHAADVVDGTSSLTYSLNGKMCEAVNFAPRSTGDVSLARALRAWARSHPSARVAVSGSTVKLTACDPGTKVAAPSHAHFVAADDFLNARTQFTEGIAEGGKGNISPASARCIGRAVMNNPASAKIVLRLLNAQPTASQEAQLRSALSRIGPTCQRDPDSGLR
jgi:hypothetical protein